MSKNYIAQRVGTALKRFRFNSAKANFRPETATPLTLAATGHIGENDPRFNPRNNGDTHSGICCPDRFDLVAQSRYAQYVANSVKSIQAKAVVSEPPAQATEQETPTPEPAPNNV